MTRSVSQQVPSNPDHPSSTPPKSTENNVDDAFGTWKSGSTLTVYDRVLISIIAVSFAQSPEISGGISNYINTINEESRQAFRARADSIMLEYSKAIRSEVMQDKIETTWVDAAKYGLRVYLEDFADTQIVSFRELSETVKDRTSIKTQCMVAFGIALALAIFVGAVKPAVTVWDDVKTSIWPDKKG